MSSGSARRTSFAALKKPAKGSVPSLPSPGEGVAPTAGVASGRCDSPAIACALKLSSAAIVSGSSTPSVRRRARVVPLLHRWKLASACCVRAVSTPVTSGEYVLPVPKSFGTIASGCSLRKATRIACARRIVPGSTVAAAGTVPGGAVGEGTAPPGKVGNCESPWCGAGVGAPPGAGRSCGVSDHASGMLMISPGTRLTHPSCLPLASRFIALCGFASRSSPNQRDRAAAPSFCAIRCMPSPATTAYVRVVRFCRGAPASSNQPVSEAVHASGMLMTSPGVSVNQLPIPLSTGLCGLTFWSSVSQWRRRSALNFRAIRCGQSPRATVYT